FTVSSPDALLEGFTLTGCTNTLAGSGIALSAGTLSGLRIAYNQTKMPNTSIPGGGGIHMSGGTVTNCLSTATRSSPTTADRMAPESK
ncbi:MAG: hypothetical protein IJL06_10275, partial [Kiritimatiellae bacterium]|nr:hypothetical protein [Kiritimatiellia bacterium]